MPRWFRSCVLLVSAPLLLSEVLSAAPRVPVPIAVRAQGAEEVLVATVERVEGRFERNRFGDELIVSQVVVRVDEALKSRRPSARTTFFLEGGTVGDITLRVSDLPALEPGDRAVVFLARDAAGRKVPHLRGAGVLKLDGSDRTGEGGATLQEIRGAVLSGR